LIATIGAWAVTPSSAMRIATAEPAECPITIAGRTSKACSSPATRRAISGNDSDGGVSVKPWPGRSGAITSKCVASTGSSPRQLCVAAPDPCSSSSTGPAPAAWTCQRRPPVVTNRLVSRLGQPIPSMLQAGLALTG
jgi:hypothetical protein